MHRARAALLGAVCALAARLCAAAECDLSQEVVAGGQYYVTSPNYPNYYEGHTQRVWCASTAPGARLQLSCGLDIPASKSCREDRILISTSGDESLKDAHVYCGKGTFSQVSDQNKLTMELQSSFSSRGGRFLCNLTANYPPCMCGMKKESRIVGGEDTGVNEFPFMAGLVYIHKKIIYCGASIVSAHYALTAAHCLRLAEIDDLALVVGEHDVRTGKETNATRLFRLKRFVIHPGYKKDPFVENSDDIALVRVDGIIVMSREVMPVCLPFRFRGETFANDKVEALGWGLLTYGGRKSSTLQKVGLKVLQPAMCSAILNSTDSSSQICAYYERKSTCQMDGGGPLYWQEEESRREYIVGVITSTSCALDKPVVSARVTSYLDWIASVIGKEDEYCIV